MAFLIALGFSQNMILPPFWPQKGTILLEILFISFASSNMESMLSVRGKKLLIVEKYTSRKDKETTLGISCRCTKKGCTASISVDKSEEILLERNGCHNHPCKENLEVKVRYIIY